MEDAAQKIINHYVVRNSFQEEDFIVMTTYVKLLKKWEIFVHALLTMDKKFVAHV